MDAHDFHCLISNCPMKMINFIFETIYWQRTDTEVETAVGLVISPIGYAMPCIDKKV